MRGQADGPGDVPDVRAGDGDGAVSDAGLLRGAEDGGDGEQEVPVRAGQGPRRARARVPDQRHARHGPARHLQVPRDILRLPKDTEHGARLPRRADLQGVREAPGVQEQRSLSWCCSSRWREERSHGADGRRRRGREAAQHGPLPPRLGAARRSLLGSRVRTVWRMDWIARTHWDIRNSRVGDKETNKNGRCTPFSCSFVSCDALFVPTTVHQRRTTACTPSCSAGPPSSSLGFELS